MTALFLEELAEAMRKAAWRLGKGDLYQRSWAFHLREDRKSMLQLAQTWRDPEPAAAEVEGR